MPGRTRLPVTVAAFFAITWNVPTGQSSRAPFQDAGRYIDIDPADSRKPPGDVDQVALACDRCPGAPDTPEGRAALCDGRESFSPADVVDDLFHALA